MKRISIVLFWWFLAIDAHVIAVVGPFNGAPQCRQIQTALFEGEPDVKVSACWTDEAIVPPRTVRR
jgi:hypothetical protein